jgi:hypothetical protein
MTPDNQDPGEVEVLPKDWDKPRSRSMEKLDWNNPITWVMLVPAILLGVGLVLWIVGIKLQQRVLSGKR